MIYFEPDKKYFRDDNFQRAQEIVSMFRNVRNGAQYDFSYDRPRRKIRKNFSPKERDAILSRVSVVGVERAAEEFGTTRKIIMSWIKNIDESIHTNVQDEVKAPVIEEPKPVPETPEPVEEIKEVEEVKEEIKESNTGVLSNIGVLKKSKDFTPEEREIIVARTEIIGATRAAREFHTTRWVIMNWCDNVAKSKVTNHNVDKKTVLERANEVGMRQAAREFGVERHKIARWRSAIIKQRNLAKAIKESVKEKPSKLEIENCTGNGSGCRFRHRFGFVNDLAHV